MKELNQLAEQIASDLVLVDPDDLPGLATLHEKFLQFNREVGDESNILAIVALKGSELLGKIVLSEVDDKDKALSHVGEAVVAIQSVTRDNRDSSEVDFPEDMIPSRSKPENKKKSKKKAKSQSGKSSGKEAETAKEKTESSPEKHDDILTMDLASADVELLGEFVNEAREHCSIAEQMLMDLETDAENKEAIDAIFRGFHTVKGAAGFLELNPILVLAHESETLLDQARQGEIIIKGRIADVIFESIDAMRALLDGLEETLKTQGVFDGTEIVTNLLAKLRTMIAGKDDDVDESELLSDSGKRVGDILIDMGATNQDEIDDALQTRESPEEKIGETLVKQGKVPAKAVVHALRQQKQARDINTAGVKEMVKIDTERLDWLVDTIGELVIAESMVGQDDAILSMATTKISKNLSHLNKITRELQEMGTAMRLVPVRGAFQKMARAVRDLSRKSGKKVELVMSGEDSEVDRSIVENIGDPLMHMVRNSIDHGLEMPEDRIKAGKPEIGKVWLRAFHKGGNIYFEIEDDGRGLDKDKILTKAAERGLINNAKEMTDREIYNLVILPGFSTAKKITEISGRGVGMDVVRKNIDAMRGHLEIESRPGKGTKFAMKLPLTLAIIDGMLVGVGGDRYIIPTLSVVESLRLSPGMIKTVSGRGEMIDLRGEILPIFRIRNLFSYDDRQACRGSDGETLDSTVVIVEDIERRVGIVVDKLLGQRQTVIKSLGPVFERQKWISGGAILSDGSIGLIIDIGGIINLTATMDVLVERKTAPPVPTTSGSTQIENREEKPEVLEEEAVVETV
jgi:two-component system chemotaxis sensor kinase CheA